MSGQATEQATPQKKKKARDKGDIVRSRELLSAMAMLGGVVMLGTIAHGFSGTWQTIYFESLRSAGIGSTEGDQAWSETVRHMIQPMLLPVGLVLIASFGCSLLAGVVQSGGVQVHPNAMALKLERLNPVTNLKNLFSLRQTTRLMKSMIPAGIMVILGWGALKGVVLSSPVMSMTRLPATFTSAYHLALDASWLMLLWSALDYAVEWKSWNQRLKMSKQEVREEMKESMGNPEIKGKIRRIQNAMRRRKVKADLSRASVVITNPTHYAVALEFSFETMQAPVVLAKGRDLLAAEIREEAQWTGIPLVENPPLARSLYRMVEPGQSIPFELYAAVAGILAYLYRQRMEERMRRQQQTQRAPAWGAYPVMGAGMRGVGGGM
ncbi:EscU/YscU/HrcU family type III secretion system export apparatus switch protein [Edaphobacter albus]|uniref:EscU/YscU/HrcU family type III secretion system export apparatus switch protein n=1 Tax=Edaphobacter sp. 4G125 TaxID=2763071 RepID=UPI001647C068|nr:EscU/YscU/HrcU family type III secretion system export apparatus switch protein [Edaphobacter sp. 4G125]QNI35278.1 EscU/YscU/HrcU family type III secretion system export apparatus switch protein [Edaphobacter sp. 4G125]